MGPRRHRTRGLLVAGTLAAVLLARPAAAGDDASRLVELLDLHASDDADARQEATMDLLALGPRQLENVLAVLARRVVPSSGALADSSERVLLRLLAGWPAEDVTQAIAGEVQPGDLSGVLRALELFAGAGHAPAIPAIVELVDGLEPAARQHRLVREAVDAAFAGILRRDEHAVGRLAIEVRRIDASWMPEIVSALARCRGENAFRLLDSLIGLDVRLDRRILEGFRQWSRWEISAPACARLLEKYLDAAEPELRRAAALALGSVGDAQALPGLVRALGDEDARTVHAARWALQRLSGLRGDMETEHWNAWLEREEAWLDGRGSALLQGLADADATSALRALQELAAHRWFADAIVGGTAELTRHADEAVARAACELMLRCATPEAFDELVETLTDPRPPVRDAAWAALCALTGRRLPPEVNGWLELHG